MEKLIEHTEKCVLLNECKITLPKESDIENSFIKFKNFKNKEKCPFVIYADLEFILKPIENDDRKYQIHKPLSISYFLKCSYDDSLSKYVTYDVTTQHHNETLAEWFVKELQSITVQVELIFDNTKLMNDLTVDEKNKYEKTFICHICEDKNDLFIKNCINKRKVRDHCHITGKFTFYM